MTNLLIGQNDHVASRGTQLAIDKKDVSWVELVSIPNPHHLVMFYGISTIVGYLMPNPFYTYVLSMVWFGFYGILTIVGYLMPNPLYTYILNIGFGWLGFMAY